MDDENDFLKTDPTTFLLNMNNKGYHVNLDQKQKEILARSSVPEVADNYEDGVDASLGVKAKSLLGWKRGLANCILTASQWIDPETPIVQNTSVLNNPGKYGYVSIPEYLILPGDLAIYQEGRNGTTRHAMLVSGFQDKDEVKDVLDLGKWTVPAGTPLVRYSNGHTRYKKDMPLNAVFNSFTEDDNYMDYSGTNVNTMSDKVFKSGNPIVVDTEGNISPNSTNSHINFFRKYYPGDYDTLLPEVVVTNKGNYTPAGQRSIYIQNGIATKGNPINVPLLYIQY